MNPYLPVIAVFLFSRIISYTLLTFATEPELYYQYAASVRNSSLESLYRGNLVRSYPFLSELQVQPPEYPQLTALFLTPPLWLAEAVPGIDRLTDLRSPGYPPAVAAYGAALGLQLFLVDVLLLMLVYLTARELYPLDSRRMRAGRLSLYVAASASFAPVWFDRLDTVIGVFVVGAILAFAKQRSRCAYALLVLGSGFKLVPLFLLPLWVMAAASQRSNDQRTLRRNLVWEASVAGAMLLAGIAMLYLFGGGEKAFIFLQPHASRGIQPESSYGPFIVLADPATRATFNYGGFHLTGPLATRLVPFTTLLLLSLIAVSYVIAGHTLIRGRFRMRANHGEPRLSGVATLTQPLPDGRGSSDAAIPTALLPTASTLTLLAFLFAGKVASPQYVIWLMPLAALLPLREVNGWRWSMWFLALCGILTLIFPLASAQISGPRLTSDTWAGPTRFGLGLIVARTLILAGLAVSLARGMRTVLEKEGLPTPVPPRLDEL